jgi:hypothetical protein
MDSKMQPVFVVGVARSGTSYLHTLLNQHPLIRMSYESRLPTEGKQCYHRFSQLNDRHAFNRLLDELITLERREDKNIWLIRSIEINRKQLYENHRVHGSFAGLVEDIFKADSPVCCFGNKMLRAELCPDILAVWPHARFIVLLRDPRAVVASQIRRFKGRRLQYAAIYCDTHFKWTFRNALNRKNYLILSYEKFIADPDDALKNLLHFCGIKDTFYRRRMLADKPAFAGSVNKWQSLLNKDQIKQIESYCCTSMKAAGYPLETAARQRKITVLEKCIELGFEKREALFYGPGLWRQKNIIKRLKRIIRT